MKSLPYNLTATFKSNHLKYFNHFFTSLHTDSQHYSFPVLSLDFSFWTLLYFPYRRWKFSTLFDTAFTTKHSHINRTYPHTHTHKLIFLPYFLTMVVSQWHHYLYYNDNDKSCSKVLFSIILSFSTQDE